MFVVCWSWKLIGRLRLLSGGGLAKTHHLQQHQTFILVLCFCNPPPFHTDEYRVELSQLNCISHEALRLPAGALQRLHSSQAHSAGQKFHSNFLSWSCFRPSHGSLPPNSLFMTNQKPVGLFTDRRLNINYSFYSSLNGFLVQSLDASNDGLDWLSSRSARKLSSVNSYNSKTKYHLRRTQSRKRKKPKENLKASIPPKTTRW